MKYIKELNYSPLSSLNMNLKDPLPLPESIWCRIVFAEYEKPNTKKHCHSFFELHLCLEGQCEYSIDGQNCVISKGQYLLVPPKMLHTIIKQSTDFKKFIWGFSIEDNSLSSEISQKAEASPIKSYDNEVSDAIQAMIINEESKNFGFYSVIVANLMSVYAYIIRDYTDGEYEQMQGNYCKKTSSFIKDISVFISDNLLYSPNADDIADQFSVSRSMLDKLCRKECGRSVAELKKLIQLEKIRELLVNTNKTLDEIADLSGFADRFTMGKFFKNHEGMPPGEYRKGIRK